MSRIGKKPIPLPSGVKIQVGEQLEVTGPKGKLMVPIPHGITFEQSKGTLEVKRESDEQAALHGLTRALVAKWYSLLPCSGRILSIAVSGRYATAVFRLGNRGSSPCDAPGTVATARFGIVKGKITSWEQVPVATKKPPAQSGPLA